jgi:hypothetical protein
MFCTKRVLTAGVAALALGGSLLAAASAQAGESTGRWRNGMVAGPYGPGYYGHRPAGYGYRPSYGYQPSYGYRHRNNGGAVAAGLIGGLALGALASSAYAAPTYSYPAYAYPSAYPAYEGTSVYAAPSCYTVRRRFVDAWGRVIVRREDVCE